MLRFAFFLLSVSAAFAAQAPANPAVEHYQNGIALAEAGDHRRAVIELQKAVEHGFRNTGALLHLLHSGFASRHYTAALDAAEQLIQTPNAAPGPLIRAGKLLFDRLFYKQAAAAFSAARLADKSSGEALHYLALTNYLIDRHSTAVELLAPLDRPDSSPDLHVLLGSAQAASGNATAAERRLRDLIRRHPSSPHAYLNLALILLDQGQDTPALTLLDQLRALPTAASPNVIYVMRRQSCGALLVGAPGSPAHTRAAYLNNLAEQLAAKHNHNSAVELFRAARAAGYDSPDLLLRAGSSCLDLNQVPTAIEILRRAARLVPDSPAVHAGLGRAYARAGTHASAAESFTKAARLAPSSANYTGLGRALTAIDDAPGALAAFHQAVQSGPSDPLAHYELGRALAKSGDTASAELRLRHALDLEPDFYEAHYALGQLLAKTNRPTEAAEALKRFQHSKAALTNHAIVNAGFASQNH